jgi:hypothetical protein
MLRLSKEVRTWENETRNAEKSTPLGVHVGDAVGTGKRIKHLSAEQKNVKSSKSHLTTTKHKWWPDVESVHRTMRPRTESVAGTNDC